VVLVFVVLGGTKENHRHGNGCFIVHVLQQVGFVWNLYD
jgi:hypothetical protein